MEIKGEMHVSPNELFVASVGASTAFDKETFVKFIIFLGLPLDQIEVHSKRFIRESAKASFLESTDPTIELPFSMELANEFIDALNKGQQSLGSDHEHTLHERLIRDYRT